MDNPVLRLERIALSQHIVVGPLVQFLIPNSESGCSIPSKLVARSWTPALS